MASLASQLNQQRQPADSPAAEKSSQTGLVNGTSTAALTTTPTSSTTPKKENLKILIRHLPPDMEASFFYALVKPWINNDSINDTYFVPGRISKKKNKKSIDTRVYIYMKNSECLQKFHAAFNKEIFHELEGDVKPSLEIAPYQGKLKPAKPSNLANTINEDPEFQQFIKDINALEIKKEDQQAKEAEEAKKEATLKTDRIVAVAGTGPILGVPTKEESLPVEQPKAVKATPALVSGSEPEQVLIKKENEKPKKPKKKKEKTKDTGDKKGISDGKKPKGTKQLQEKSKEESIVKKEGTFEKEKKKKNKKTRANKEAIGQSSSKDTKIKPSVGNTKESASKSAASSSKNGFLGKPGNQSTDSGKSTPKDGVPGKSTPKSFDSGKSAPKPLDSRKPTLKTTDSGRSTPKPTDSGRSTPKSIESGKATAEFTDTRKPSKFNESGKSVSKKINEPIKSTSKRGLKSDVDSSKASSGNEEFDFIDNLLGESVNKIISDGKDQPSSKPRHEIKNNRNKKNKATGPILSPANGLPAEGNFSVPKGPASSKPPKNTNRKKKPTNSSSGQTAPVSSQNSEASSPASVPKGPRSVVEGGETKKPKSARRSKPKPPRKASDEKPNGGNNNPVPTGPRSAA